MRVWHYFLGSLWIFLHSLQHNLDHWVHHDLLYLWVLHCVLGALVVMITAWSRPRLNGHHSFLLCLFNIVIIRIDLQAVVVGLHCLVVLFQKMVAITLPQIRFHKLGFKLDTFISVLQCLLHDHELDVGGAPVRIDGDGFGIAAQAFVVFFDSSRVSTFLEQFITFLSMLLSLCRVDVCLGFGILFNLLSFREGHFDNMALIF